MQPLGIRGLVVAFGFQAGVAGRSAEHFEERTADAAIRQLDGPILFRDEGVRFGDGAGVSFSCQVKGDLY